MDVRTSFYDGLAYFSSNLYEIGMIQPNSYAHKDRAGHFINTGGNWSNWIPGGQSIACLYKQHSEDQLASDIEAFENQLTARIFSHLAILREQPTTEIKAESCMEMRLLSERIQQAVNGIETGGGLKGLVKTYSSNDQFVQRINSVIEKLESHQQIANIIFQEIQTDDETEAVRHQSERIYKVLQEENCMVGADCPSPFKYMVKYTAAIYFNVIQNSLKGFDWCNEIEKFGDASLFLGALPIQSPNYDSIEVMKESKIKAVLSINEPFENRSSGMIIDPVKPEQLAAAGISQLQIYSPDFETISEELIELGVEFIHEKISKGESVYVHCKAGRGRSALVLICYLMKHQGMKALDALALVKQKRPQAGYGHHESKYQTMLDMEKKYSS